MLSASRVCPAILLSLACAACHSDPLQGIDADATAAAVLDFGSVAVGDRKVLPLMVTNTGVVTLAVQRATVAAPFAVDATPPPVETGASGALQIAFAPASAGPFDQPLDIALSSARTPSLSVRVKGIATSAAPGGTPDGGASDAGHPDGGGPDAGEVDGGSPDGGTPDAGVGPAAMEVEPLGLSFSAVIPSAPAPQAFRIHNVGGRDLHWSLSLAQAALLSVAPASGTLAAGVAIEVVVSVPAVPAGPQSFSQTITVTSLETASQDVTVAVQFTKAGGPPPPPPQYGGSVWPKFHQGNTCTGLSSVTTHTKGHVRFSVPFGPARQTRSQGTYVGSPTLADDGTVYQQGGDGTSGTLTAFEPLHGVVQWSTPVTSVAARAPSIEGTPTVVASGSIFVMTGSEARNVTHFYKVSRGGQIVWSDPGGYADGFDSSPALGADGSIYVAYDEGPAILFLNQGNLQFPPHELGRITLTGFGSGSRLESQSGAIADDGTAYWASNGLLWAMNKAGPLWSLDATPNGGAALNIGSRSAPMLTPEGKVIFAYADLDAFGTAITVVTAVSGGPTGGQQLWQTTLNPTSPVVTVGPSTSGALADRVGLSSPALGPDGTIYIGHADGLYALNPANGNVKWHAGSAAVASSPAVGADGTIFFGAMDGTLSAMSAAGQPLWSVTTGGQVNSSPAIGADGAVFAASDDGNLYAVE